MNTKKLLLILGVVIILLGLVLGLLFVFLGIYNSSQNATDSQVISTAATDPVQYLKESWQFYDGEWDKNTNTVTAIRVYDLTLENAQKIGDRIFTDDLSPESYLAQAMTIAADLSSRFSMENVTVIISFRGSDSQELFSVDSKGNVSTCWKSENNQNIE